MPRLAATTAPAATEGRLANRPDDVRMLQALKAPSPASSQASSRNALFALSATARPPRVNPFYDTTNITLPQHGGDASGLTVFAGSAAEVDACSDDTTGCCIYLWGRASHPDVPRTKLLPWILQTLASGQTEAFAQLVGLYVILIDDRRVGRVRMISDHMGLRPWFVGTRDGQLVCGSDVWALQSAGFDMGGVNYDAVASWLRYAFDCTGQSLFTGFKQLDFAAIGTWENGAYTEAAYASFVGGGDRPAEAELIERIHHDMSRTFDALTSDLDHVSVALSGGYDSRYLAGLASRRKHLRIEAFSICDREAEGIAATLVAEKLGIPHHVIPTDGSAWNIFEEPFHFSPGGFPITKQLSHIAAAQRPGVPCLNGFVGDPIVRGTIDRAEGKLERETDEDLATVFQRIHCLNHRDARFDLIDPNIVRRADERTLAVWRRQMARWTHTGHPFVATNVFVRQRHYLANNFLQHLDVAEAIVPFAALDLLRFKLRNDATSYSFSTYPALFAAFFPEISDVPHNSKMGVKNDLPKNTSRCEKKWAVSILRALGTPDRLSLVSRRKSVTRLLGALMGRRDLEAVSRFLNRLRLLDDRLRQAHIDFDWNGI